MRSTEWLRAGVVGLVGGLCVTACGTEAGVQGGGDDVADLEVGGSDVDPDLPDDVSIDDADGGGGGGSDAGEDGASGDGGSDAGADVWVGPRPGGNACMSDAECAPGTYCEMNFGPPYCAPVPDVSGVACERDEDCELSDGDGVFCCSEFFGYQQCTPAFGGACGEAGGGQADSCAVGGQSDCREGTFCLFGGEEHAYCSEFCDPADDGCAEGSYCFETGDGQGLCLEHGERPELSPCGDSVLGCGPGLFCVEVDPERPALSFCGRFCERDSECEEGSSCNDFGVCLPNGELGAGEPCVEDRFACGEGLLCYGAGSRTSYCTELCRRDRDCDGGLVCQVFNRETGEGLCVPEGDRPPGSFCGDAPLTCADGVCTGGYDVYDAGAYCVATCERPDDCAAGTRCELGEEGVGYCLPAGEAGQGESCALDPLTCAAGHFCLGSGGTGAICVRACLESTDCAEGNWCTASGAESGVCVPVGGIPAGGACELDSYTCAPGSYCADTDGVCIADCTDDASVCGAEEACVNFDPDGRSFCYPFGELGYGEDCSERIRGCEEGLYCIGRGSEAARCSSLCDESADCPGDDWCQEGVCVPPGDVGRGGGCEGDPFACQEGLLCLLESSPGAFCAAECTGFASLCGDGEACRFVGYSRSFCLGVGEAGHGDPCAEDQFACDADSWCVNAGTETAVCVQTCSFAPDTSPDGTTCRFVAGGLGVCLSAGLSPEDPLNPGGAPL